MNQLTQSRQTDRFSHGHLYLITGIVPLVFLAVTSLTVSVGLFFSFPITQLSLLVGAGMAIGVCIAGSNGYRGLRRLIVFVILVGIQGAIVLVSIGVSRNVFDMSYDGQWYHQDAIIRLKNGWNPVLDFTIDPENDVADAYTNTIVKTYPKGPWYIAATIYALTNHIEDGKVTNVWLVFAVFSLCMGASLRPGSLSVIQRSMISFFAALNPVSLYQVFSFYVDGQVASLITCLAILLYTWMMDANVFVSLGLICSIVLLSNAKLTAALYAVIFVVGAIVWLVWRKEWRDSISLKALSLTGAVLVLFVGLNPYVTNFVAYQNPFYPVVASNIGIMDGQRPANFENMNRVERLLYSVFSYSENVKAPRDATLKLPFSLISDPRQFDTYDITIGGLGPLFSGACLVAVLIVILSTSQRRYLPAYYAIVVLMISELSHAETWWARFAPQLWLLPVIGYFIAATLKTKLGRTLEMGLAMILIINLGLVGSRHFVSVLKQNQALHERLSALSLETYPVTVQLGRFRSYRVRLIEQGVRFTEAGAVMCEHPIQLMTWANGVLICTNNLSPK